jgi:phosphohistidine phosphatase SixA
MVHCYDAPMQIHSPGANASQPPRLKRKPFLTPIWLLGLAALSMIAFLGLDAWVWFTADTTTVIIVRHAEKAPGGGDDPSLTAAGEARAALLARMFGDGRMQGHIDAIYATATVRNRMTAAPLAASLGLAPSIVSTRDPAGLARRILREHEGGRVLVVGHADTIPALVGAFTGSKNLPPIADDEYGTMYIVTVPRVGRPNFLRLTY